MKTFLLPLTVFITFLLTTGSPQKTIIPADDDYYVLKIHNVFGSRVDSGAYYCLIKANEKDLRSLMAEKFDSRNAVFDSLFDQCGAVGILDNNAAYWEHICSKGTLDFSGVASPSSEEYSLLGRLNADSNYKFNNVYLAGGSKQGFCIGISKVTQANFQEVIDPTGVCAFGGAAHAMGASKLVVLRKGFTMIPG